MDYRIRRDLHARSIVAASLDYPAGTTIDPHRHSTHQLIYAARGRRCACKPHGAPGSFRQIVHCGCRLEARRTFDSNHRLGLGMRTLYVSDELQCPLGDRYAVVAVPRLLRELILRLVDLQTNAPDPTAKRTCVSVILDELQVLETQPLFISLPEDPRLRTICEAIQSDPGRSDTASDWGARLGISGKTLERDFSKNFGISFGQWRQQVRLLASLERLAAGEPITAVALDLGYKSPSSFTAMFRKALGSTPGKYFV